MHVLRDVDLAVYPGEVTALVGDNGAGKSTLVKCIAGIHGIDSGEVTFEGVPVSLDDPRVATGLGIEFVYQDLALADNLDITQNMFLGREIRRLGAFLADGEMEKKARETLEGLSVRTVSSVRQKVASLSGGQRQTVAIAKAVLWNSKVVVLDEPTAALGVAQTRQVLDLVRRLADQGRGVVLISHNMNDVMEVADRVVALYLGQVAAEVKTSESSTTQIVEPDHRRPQRRHRARAGRREREHLRSRDDHLAHHRPRDPAARRLLPRRRGALHRQRLPGLDRAAALGRPGCAAERARPRRADADLHAGQRQVPRPLQHRQPARAGRLHRRDRDGAGVRAPARRDRPVRRYGGRSGGRHRRCRDLPRPVCTARLPDFMYWSLVVGLALATALAAWLKAWTGAVVVALGFVLVVTNLTQHLVPGLIAAVCIGAAVGTLNGYLVAKVGIPSLVVTLALFLAWQGVVQFALQGQPINVSQFQAVARPHLRHAQRDVEPGSSSSSSSRATSPTPCWSRCGPSGPAWPVTRSAWCCCAAARSRSPASSSPRSPAATGASTRTAPSRASRSPPSW
ncbi:ATP-binding cassette domain-containing protein [Nocardioides convexus]|uniref:ATP-binding cassette domain-containing protein n=1 Tax=Nocardioides convexus TaxID=2712224 RepID=UPI0024182DA3|nr:ATP-binding cassette domain-containing protein [Nocardioides convexus]